MNKLIRSSADPEKVSLTLQGAVTLIAITLLSMTSIDLSANEITAAIEAIVTIIAELAMLVGLIRKVYVGLGLGVKDDDKY